MEFTSSLDRKEISCTQNIFSLPCMYGRKVKFDYLLLFIISFISSPSGLYVSQKYKGKALFIFINSLFIKQYNKHPDSLRIVSDKSIYEEQFPYADQ